MDFVECVATRTWNNLKSYLPPIIALVGVILALALLACLLSGTVAVCLPAWFEACLYALGIVIAYAVLILLLSVLLEGAACLFGAIEDAFTNAAVTADADGSIVSSGLTAMDCASARAELDRLKRQLDNARAIRDDRAADVERARRRVNAAVAAIATAIAAVAAVPFWRPDLLIGAIAAVVVAAGLVVHRGRQLAQAENRLRTAQNALEKAIADVAAATILVDAICGEKQSEPPDEPPPDGGGLEFVPRAIA